MKHFFSFVKSVSQDFSYSLLNSRQQTLLSRLRYKIYRKFLYVLQLFNQKIYSSLFSRWMYNIKYYQTNIYTFHIFFCILQNRIARELVIACRKYYLGSVNYCAKQTLLKMLYFSQRITSQTDEQYVSSINIGICAPLTACLSTQTNKHKNKKKLNRKIILMRNDFNSWKQMDL